MVYTSLPVYLDPPNWSQQQPQPPPASLSSQQPLQGIANVPAGDVYDKRLLLQYGHAAAETGTIRPNSMSERARLAKVPQPEQALKCPRCDSTNTKFCYFNNYSLSQPRHFCKNCRRYWTRGGALRNVPVGGGCRRNKRSKSSRSKSASAPDAKPTGPSSSVMVSGGTGAIGNDLIGASTQLPFLPPLHSLPDFGSSNVGFSYCGLSSVDPVQYSVATGSDVALESWRLPLPFFGMVEPTAMSQPPASLGFYRFNPGSGNQLAHAASVKVEPRSQLERQFTGVPGSADPYWLGGGGSDAGNRTASDGDGSSLRDLSGFGSTSTGLLL